MVAGGDGCVHVAGRGEQMLGRVGRKSSAGIVAPRPQAAVGRKRIARRIPGDDGNNVVEIGRIKLERRTAVCSAPESALEIAARHSGTPGVYVAVDNRQAVSLARRDGGRAALETGDYLRCTA